MIVIHKETLGDGTIFNMSEIALIRTVHYGRIDDELDNIRSENGVERELIKGDMNTSVCLVYDDVRWYVSKV